MREIIPLALVAAGQTAEVCHVAGGAAETQRLHELGICCGSTIEIVQQGSPCIIRLQGSKFCFRESELTQVFVRRS